MDFTGLNGFCYNSPAVTLAFALLREIKVIRALLYVIFQVVGAICGAALVYALIPGSLDSEIGATIPTVDGWRCFMLETLGTATFVLVILMMALHPTKNDAKRVMLPLTVWMTLMALIFFIGPYTGCSVNPARSFGPALVANYWKYQYIYWVAPPCGSVVAAALYFLIFKPHPFKMRRKGLIN
eukprot:TRINITY_DN4232_c0_g1_i1.p1 TRINITY_DN4232_c0_g1~~TRINITY_DN4232_c0_g1_i1.p1  ORF type:complete len:183 (-),score=40.48 TRINITY_DN4232_c0_g1_i1:194-742(-)